MNFVALKQLPVGEYEIFYHEVKTLVNRDPAFSQNLEVVIKCLNFDSSSHYLQINNLTNAHKFKIV